ncbi:MAG: LLM class flavin-dependent oxidoreductase [Candidatus Rokubacteria bacterium]|nr:LLM class flavin-dependent oxidoreductase [Candidatus Rokubacteria bacterium]
MHCGIFVEEMRQGADQVGAFRDAFGIAERAEAWGADCVWLGEIHFAPTRSVISASLQVASSIATRTRRLRIGTAVTVLPLNHPLRIAEEVATLDHISEGRVEFGIGRSGVVRSYDTYGVPYGESKARFNEALAIIREAWKGEPFSYTGEFYKVANATVTPRPYQTPHPPLRMAATSDETFPAAGELGLPIFIGLRAAEIPDLQPLLAAYRESWRKAGHATDPSVYLRIPVYVSPTERGAVEEPRQSLTTFFNRQSELARAAVGRAGTGPTDRRRMQAERMASLTYEDILANKVAFGTPKGVIGRLTQLREELGIDGIVAEPNPGGLIPEDLETRSMRLLLEDVMPAFR